MTVGSKQAAGIIARINPEFDGELRHKIMKDYLYAVNRGVEMTDEGIRDELRTIAGRLSAAIFHGESTVELLIRREVLYLIAEDRGLM